MKRSPLAFASLALSLSVALLTGCGGQPAAPPSVAHEHNHPSEGPHHGHLIELGNEEYHAELAHDDKAKTVAIYVLDSKAADEVPIEATEVTLNLMVEGKPQQFVLPAAPQAADPLGKASCFQLTDAKLFELLESSKAKGRLSLVIEGKPYSGTIEHEAHKH